MLREQVLEKFSHLSDDIFKHLQNAHNKYIEVTGQQFAEAAGFAMIVSTKGALGLSVERGDGFVVANLGKDAEGTLRFSAPLFIHLTKVGVGVQIGYTHVYTLLLFSTKEQLAAFSQKEVVLGRDLYMNQEPQLAPGQVEEDASSVMSNSSTIKAAKALSCADGVVVDVSINGGTVSPNTEVNQLVYQNLKEPAAILGGVAPIPEQFEKLYDKLRKERVL